MKKGMLSDFFEDHSSKPGVRGARRSRRGAGFQEAADDRQQISTALQDDDDHLSSEIQGISEELAQSGAYVAYDKKQSQQLKSDDVDEDLLNWEQRYAMKRHYPLDASLYMYVLVSFVMPKKGLGVHGFAHPIVLLALCLLAKFTFLFGLGAYVLHWVWHRQMALQNTYRTAYVGLNQAGFPRLSMDDAAAYCGSFMWGMGQGDFGYKYYYQYDRSPDGSWAYSPHTERDELSQLLHRAHFWSPDSLLLVTFMFLFICFSLKDLGDLFCFSRFVFFSPRIDTGDDGEAYPADKRWIRHEKEDWFLLLSLNSPAKLFGLAVVMIRIFVMGVIIVVGCAFLATSTDILSIVLNSVALLFIADIDGVILNMVLDSTVQSFLGRIRCPMYTTKFMRDHPIGLLELFNVERIVQVPLVIAAVVVAFLVNQRWCKKQLNTVMAACLFLGASPHGAANYQETFPVPGFCESLLELRCDLPDGKCFGNNDGEARCRHYDFASAGYCGQQPVPPSLDEKQVCVSTLKGNVEAVSALTPGRLSFLKSNDRWMLPGEANEIKTLRKWCRAMWQPRPCSAGPGGACMPAPRKRETQIVYHSTATAAPFWCPWTPEAMMKILGDRHVLEWLSSSEAKEVMARCSPHTLSNGLKTDDVGGAPCPGAPNPPGQTVV